MMRALWLVVLSACFSTPARPTGDGGVTDDASDPGDGNGDSGAPLAANVVFVTKGSISGNELSMAGIADARCRDAASVAGLPEPSTYVAWFSDANRSALSLLTGSSGWVRPDGKPFANTPADIASGQLFYPPRIDQFQNDAFVDGELVATGTSAAGAADVLCNLGGGGSITVGLDDASAPLWTQLYDVDCSTNFKIYCFGTGRTADVTPTFPVDGLRAFLSSPTEWSDISNLDGMCGSDATTAGLAGTYRALVATTAQAPRDRIGNPAGKSWYRVDGVRVTGPAMTELEAPLDVDAAGAHHDAPVWSGSPSPTQKAPSSGANCNDWQSPDASTTSLGHSVRSSAGAFSGFGNLPCFDARRVYCFQSE